MSASLLKYRKVNRDGRHGVSVTMLQIATKFAFCNNSHLLSPSRLMRYCPLPRLRSSPPAAIPPIVGIRHVPSARLYGGSSASNETSRFRRCESNVPFGLPSHPPQRQARSRPAGSSAVAASQGFLDRASAAQVKGRGLERCLLPAAKVVRGAASDAPKFGHIVLYPRERSPRGTPLVCTASPRPSDFRSPIAKRKSRLRLGCAHRGRHVES